jgi:MFS family permease
MAELRMLRVVNRFFWPASSLSARHATAPGVELGVTRTLFVLLLFAFVYTHQVHFDAPTPVSRLDILHALFVHKTLRIDAYSNTPDKAIFCGHYYSDKAPGTVAIALPSFAVAVGVLSATDIPLDSRPGWLVSSWISCAASNGLLAAFGGAALFAWLSRMVVRRCALITTLAIFLGGAPMPYATAMFSHALVVGCVAIALHSSKPGSAAVPGGTTPRVLPTQRTLALPTSFGRWVTNNRWDLLAGHCCGWALASEYTSGLVVVGFFLWKTSKGWHHAMPLFLAAVPPLLLIPLYSWACFGNPFILPYSLQASFPTMKQGLYAIKWPDPDTALNLLLSPARGLLFWTPFLVLALFGYRKLATIDRSLFWLAYAVPALQILVISGRSWDWPAGHCLGPRYLAPILPLLALPCALALQSFPRTGLILAAWSITITTLATLTDACPAYRDHPNPLLDLHVPLLLKGEFSPNLGTVLGLPPYASVAIFYVVLTAGIIRVWRLLPGDTYLLPCDHTLKGEQ